MSMLKSLSFQRFQFYWIIISVVVFFFGLILSSAGVLIDHMPIGRYLLVVGGLSILIYFVVSLLQWLTFKKGQGIKNLITAYLLLSVLCILGGLVGAFLTYPDGMTIFISGVVLMGIFWVGKLIQFIAMKPEDFKS